MTATDTYPKTIPWVTRWTGEKITEVPFGVNPFVGGPGGSVFIDPKFGTENRDENGVLWRPEGINRKGSPEFSQVNSNRQRACMLKGLCQVCGKKIDERPIRWLMVPAQLEHLSSDNDKTVDCTQSPPTCSDCIPIAQALCPAIGQAQVIYRVLEYRIWGYSGELAWSDPATMQIRRRNNAAIQIGSPALKNMLAKQLIVEFTKYVPE
jgi:hypothetical protein